MVAAPRTNHVRLDHARIDEGDVGESRLTTQPGDPTAPPGSTTRCVQGSHAGESKSMSLRRRVPAGQWATPGC